MRDIDIIAESSTLNPYGDITWLTDQFQSTSLYLLQKNLHAVNYQSVVEEYSSTVVINTLEELQGVLFQMFREGGNEIFEDGMHTNFSRKLVGYVSLYGNSALEIIKELILGSQVSTPVAADALKWLGLMDTDAFINERRILLEFCLLKSTSTWIRDGAIVGLSYIDNPQSITSVQQALEQETAQWLKGDIETVLKQLIETRAV